MARYNTGVLYNSGVRYTSSATGAGKQRSTMKIPSADLIGFTTQVKEFLNKYKAPLIAKNYDPTNDMADLGTKCGTFSTEDQKQESMKTDLKNQTNLVNGLGNDLYDLTSSTLDAAIGKLGKTTPEGKEGARIRSNLRGRGGSDTPPPPPPNP